MLTQNKISFILELPYPFTIYLDWIRKFFIFSPYNELMNYYKALKNMLPQAIFIILFTNDISCHQPLSIS